MTLLRLYLLLRVYLLYIFDRLLILVLGTAFKKRQIIVPLRHAKTFQCSLPTLPPTHVIFAVILYLFSSVRVDA